MKALISPQENNRIAEVSANEFPIAPPLFWVTCPDDTTTDWTFEGGEFNPPVMPEPTLEELSEAVRLALQSAIDDKAISFGFSGGDSIIQYAGFANKWQSFALVFANWEVQIWDEAELYKAEVIAGTKPMLSPSEAVALMPEYPE